MAPQATKPVSPKPELIGFNLIYPAPPTPDIQEGLIAWVTNSTNLGIIEGVQTGPNFVSYIPSENNYMTPSSLGGSGQEPNNGYLAYDPSSTTASFTLVVEDYLNNPKRSIYRNNSYSIPFTYSKGKWSFTSTKLPKTILIEPAACVNVPPNYNATCYNITHVEK